MVRLGRDWRQKLFREQGVNKKALSDISALGLSIWNCFRHLENKILMFSMPELLNVLSKSAYDYDTGLIMFRRLSNAAPSKNEK